MNLKIKTTFALLGTLLIFLMSFGFWKQKELELYWKRTSMLEDRLIESENCRISYLKLYSPIYNNYSDNKSLFQEKIGHKSSVLVYRFSNQMCAVCFQEDLYEIEQFQKEIGKEKILLLPAYPDDRMGMLELSNVLAEKFHYINISLASLIIPFYEDDYLQRYFAVIDKDGNLTMVFFPRLGEVNLTRKYLSEVKKIL